jgi:hypothetical protein
MRALNLENANNPSYNNKKKRRGIQTKKEPEPLIELLYQEFPKTDPIEIERITKRVKQWLEQKYRYYEKMSNKIARKLGERDTGTLVSKAYPRCIEALLQELNQQVFTNNMQKRK